MELASGRALAIWLDDFSGGSDGSLLAYADGGILLSVAKDMWVPHTGFIRCNDHTSPLPAQLVVTTLANTRTISLLFTFSFPDFDFDNVPDTLEGLTEVLIRSSQVRRCPSFRAPRRVHEKSGLLTYTASFHRHLTLSRTRWPHAKTRR